MPADKRLVDNITKIKLDNFDALSQDQQNRDTEILRSAVTDGAPCAAAAALDGKSILKILREVRLPPKFNKHWKNHPLQFFTS